MGFNKYFIPIEMIIDGGRFFTGCHDLLSSYPLVIVEIRDFITRSGIVNELTTFLAKKWLVYHTTRIKFTCTSMLFVFLLHLVLLIIHFSHYKFILHLIKYDKQDIKNMKNLLNFSEIDKNIVGHYC